MTTEHFPQNDNEDNNEPFDPEELPLIWYLFLIGCGVFIGAYLVTQLITFLLKQLFSS